MTDLMQELQQIRTLARQFAQAELRPQVESWDQRGQLDDQLLRQVAELGFLGMMIPEAHGGMGFDLPTFTTALAEIAWGEPAVAVLILQSTVVSQLLERHGSDALKQQWLESLATGAAFPCLALSEENAGSELAATATRASREGGGWRITGTKAWVTNARTSDLALILAAIDPDRFGLFVVPKEAGWRAGERVETLGLRPLEIGGLDVEARLGDDALLLGPARVAALQAEWSAVARAGVAGIAVGIAQAALDHALAYADQREQFGRKLREFEGLQFKLADMASCTEAARSLLQRAAAAADPRLITMAKVFASETAMSVSTDAVQVYGGYGYMRDYPVEKLMRDAKAMELLESANEQLRVDIALSYYEES